MRQVCSLKAMPDTIWAWRSQRSSLICSSVISTAFSIASDIIDSAYLHYDDVHLIEALNGRKVHSMLAPLFRQMRQLLSEGGQLVIVEPNFEKALGTKYHDLHYHAQPGVKSGDHVDVTLGVGKEAIELHHDIFRTQEDYRCLLKEARFDLVAIIQPRPTGWNMFRWWQAVIKPPFLIIVAR